MAPYIGEQGLIRVKEKHIYLHLSEVILFQIGVRERGHPIHHPSDNSSIFSFFWENVGDGIS